MNNELTKYTRTLMVAQWVTPHFIEYWKLPCLWDPAIFLYYSPYWCSYTPTTYSPISP